MARNSARFEFTLQHLHPVKTKPAQLCGTGQARDTTANNQDIEYVSQISLPRANNVICAAQ